MVSIETIVRNDFQIMIKTAEGFLITIELEDNGVVIWVESISKGYKQVISRKHRKNPITGILETFKELDNDNKRRKRASS